MNRYKGIIGYLRMKYEQFIIREVDRLGLGFIWNSEMIDEDDAEHFSQLFSKGGNDYGNTQRTCDKDFEIE